MTILTNEFQNFRQTYSWLLREFKAVSKIVKTDTWQGADITNKPEMATHELEDIFFSYPIGTEELQYHRMQIVPNWLWADRHFVLDRVSGEPLNPGKTWEQWPWALKADEFRNEHGQFNHSYAERYWPKLAGLTDQGELSGTKYALGDVPDTAMTKGIRYPYGDLSDVVNLLVRNPMTRNAYLPVWFPEDTGVVHGGRTPCSIGYLFRMRNERLNIFYDIRSCDMRRHFKDDVYLTIRLALWVLDQCRKQDERWKTVRPGRFAMHIGSLHIFRNDWTTVMGDLA